MSVSYLIQRRSEYGVELAACDNVFLMKEAMDYISIVRTVRNLFK